MEMATGGRAGEGGANERKPGEVGRVEPLEGGGDLELQQRKGSVNARKSY